MLHCLADTGGPGGQWQHRDRDARDSRRASRSLTQQARSLPLALWHCQWHWQGLRLLAPPGRVGEVVTLSESEPLRSLAGVVSLRSGQVRSLAGSTVRLY
jgi:hypothetical protein